MDGSIEIKKEEKKNNSKLCLRIALSAGKIYIRLPNPLTQNIMEIVALAILEAKPCEWNMYSVEFCTKYLNAISLSMSPPFQRNSNKMSIACEDSNKQKHYEFMIITWALAWTLDAYFKWTHEFFIRLYWIYVGMECMVMARVCG